METQTHLTEKLRAIVDERPRSIRNRVAQDAIDYGDNPEAFFKDLLSHGCISGMVSTMTYYADTHAFYDEFYEAIEEIRVDYVESAGSPIEVSGDLKNCLSWFAYEHVAWQMSHELELGL